MARFRSRAWAIAGGLIAAAGAAFLLFVILAWLAFPVLYGCNPSHRAQPDPHPCSDLFVTTALLAIPLLCLAGATLAFVMARRSILRMFN